jgi:hypothetical protein
VIDDARQLVELMAQGLRDVHEANSSLGLNSLVVQVRRDESVTGREVLFVMLEENHPAMAELKWLSSRIVAAAERQTKVG